MHDDFSGSFSLIECLLSELTSRTTKLNALNYLSSLANPGILIFLDFFLQEFNVEKCSSSACAPSIYRAVQLDDFILATIALQLGSSHRLVFWEQDNDTELRRNTTVRVTYLSCSYDTVLLIKKAHHFRVFPPYSGQ